jgi:UDP-2-acetamido-2-deoxy-ribo-hexuluronate aminotransferase
MKVPFIDLKRQYQDLGGDIRERVMAVLDHGAYINGPEVTEFEEKLAQFAGVEHVIGCSSGTDALLMPLMAWDLKPGDAVFTTPFSFIATAEVVALLGATPIFVDIDERTFNIDPHLLEETIKRVKAEGKLRPRAIIPVDLFGLPADYDAIQSIADAHELLVLEDTAQGLGGVYKGKVAGSFGDAAATSFYPAKPLGGYGDGGAILTNDGELAHKLRSIREHGKGEDRYDNVRVGINGRLDSLQAAVLLVKLAAFPEELNRRNQVADWYAKYLERVTIPLIPDGYRSSWAQYSVLTDDRDGKRARLGERGIPSVVYYVKPLHLQPAFAHFGSKPGDCPVAERSSQRIFSLPMHPYLTEEQVRMIASEVNTV